MSIAASRMAGAAHNAASGPTAMIGMAANSAIRGGVTLATRIEREDVGSEKGDFVMLE